jgi:hypothetical protein
MEQQHLSPEAVEALAVSLAAKMEAHKSGARDMADQLVLFQQEDRKFKTDFAAWQKEVSDGIHKLTFVRTDVPLIAIGISLVAVVLATIALIGTARASQRASEAIQARDVACDVRRTQTQ